MNNYRTFDVARQRITQQFVHQSKRIHTKKWQGQDVSLRPDMVSYELLNCSFEIPLFDIESLDHWRGDIKPNLPWADDHFEERVCGAPLNPGTQWQNWPWASSADKHRTEGEMFNHTYMERLWPQYANKTGPIKTVEEFNNRIFPKILPHEGIRHEYGDLFSLVGQLAREPDTRQAYIPLYFPEDTGLEGRKPCTLGYQFIMRDNRLHGYYPLRSCDFVRHWADDCYLAIRLLLWILDECRKLNPQDWVDVKPGSYAMHCTSLHVFANDAIKLGIKR